MEGGVEREGIIQYIIITITFKHSSTHGGERDRRMCMEKGVGRVF